MVNATTELADDRPAGAQVEFDLGPKLTWLQQIGNSKYLGLYLLAPAGIFILMFFLIPVVMTRHSANQVMTPSRFSMSLPWSIRVLQSGFSSQSGTS